MPPGVSSVSYTHLDVYKRQQLVKVNVDENPHFSGQLRVQSIPAVFAFKNGQPVDGFMGALPESQIKTFIEKHVGEVKAGGVQSMLDAAAESLKIGEVGGAAQSYAQAVSYTHLDVYKRQPIYLAPMPWRKK